MPPLCYVAGLRGARPPSRSELFMTFLFRIAHRLGCALVLLALAGTGAAWSQTPRNIVILFADGTTLAQHEFGRHSSQLLRRQPYAVTSDLMRRGSYGFLATHSNNAYVTDSAAAASAMSTGIKVNNGAISIGPNGETPATLMESARRQGKRIGLVSTANVYDASPAAFSVHAKSRRDYQAIVDQYSVLQPEVLLGGGADFFQPAGSNGGKRTDSRNLIDEWRNKGYVVARNTAELASAKGPRLLGLFAEEDMDFEIDRDAKEQPSLAQMTEAALRTLSASAQGKQRRDKGFVLFIENENTDSAGHRNDVASLMRDLWAFDDAVKVALAWQKHHPDTLVIVTGDHETGGFSPTAARIPGAKAPAPTTLVVNETQFRRIEGISMSFAELAERLDKKAKEGANDEALQATLTELLRKHFPGIEADEEIRAMLRDKRAPGPSFTYPAHFATLGLMVARQTGFYWSTGGHTSAPALVAAIGPGAHLFRGYQDNTEFAHHLRRLLGIKPPR